MTVFDFCSYLTLDFPDTIKDHGKHSKQHRHPDSINERHCHEKAGSHALWYQATAVLQLVHHSGQAEKHRPWESVVDGDICPLCLRRQIGTILTHFLHRVFASVAVRGCGLVLTLQRLVVPYTLLSGCCTHRKSIWIGLKWGRPQAF